MLTVEQKKRFDHDGYLNYGRVMSDEAADEMCQHLFAVMEVRGEGIPTYIGGWGTERRVIQIVNIWEADSLFRAHLHNPTILDIVSELTNADTLRVWHDQVQYKPPVIGGPTDWHQDHPYWPIIQPADLVSAWVALDDALIDNGCMWMVPGSHKWGAHKGGTLGTDPETFTPTPDLSLLPIGINTTSFPQEVKKGCAVFHHCLTWHGSPPNYSDRGRPGIAVHYMPGWTRYMPEGKTHIVEKNIHVAPGEILLGDHFPTVRENGVNLRG